MKNRLVYIELKSGHADNGPAWIGIAGASKSGTTVYSNGKALKRIRGGGGSANYFDIETGEEYWVSGVKKNNQDRHWAGGGPIQIDHAAIQTYLTETGRIGLPSNFEETDLAPARQQEHHADIEHSTLKDGFD